MASTVARRVPLGHATARWRAVSARLEVLASGTGWVRDLPVEAASRWEFVLALAAMLAIGTGALLAALMGSATLVTPGVVRVTYVGVVLMAVAACSVLLLIEAGIEGTGPLAGVASEADRDALHVTSLGLAAAMLVAARLSLPVGGMVAAVAAGALVGQFAFVAGVRDVRRAANVGMALAVAAYLGYLLTGAAAACPECSRGPWALAATGAGIVTGAVVGWTARRVGAAPDVRGLVGAGAVLFVMAATFFLVRDPVRACFTVLAIVGLAALTAIPRHVLDRSRDLAVDVGCLVLAGLEVLVGPPGTVPLGIVAVLARAATRVPSGWPRTVAAVAVGVVGVALSVNVAPPWDEPHHGFFLFPMRDVGAGKSLLVDVNAQYGVGLVYALVLLAGGMVEGITPTVLSGWTNAANVALYAGTWMLCAWLLRDWAVAGAYWLAVMASRSVAIGFAESYPSTGAWRFGLPWLLVADAAAGRDRMAPWRRLLRLAYWVVASTWSLEVALYSAALLVVDGAIEAASGWRDGDVSAAWHRVAGRVAEAGAGASTGIALLVGVTRWRAGEWPDARHYLEYFGIYGAGVGFEQPVPWAAWSPMLLGCAATMVALGARAALGKPCDPMRREAGVVALVGAYGVLQLSYYVFRPHSNNLLHVMFPSAVVATWLLGRTWRRDDAGGDPVAVGDARAVVRATVLAGVALVGAVGLTALVPRVPETLAGQVIRQWGMGNPLARPWFVTASPAPTGDRAALRSLLARRFPDATRVPMLVGDDLWLHGVIGTRHVNAFPLSFAPQDALVPVGRSSALAAARALPFGAEAVVEVDGARLDDLRREMVSVLCGRGALVVVEEDARVVVARLAERDGAEAADLCRRWTLPPGSTS